MDTELISTARLDLVPLSAAHAEEMATVLSSPALHTFTGGEPLSPDALGTRYERLVMRLPGPGGLLAQLGPPPPRRRPPHGHRPSHRDRVRGRDRLGGRSTLAGPRLRERGGAGPGVLAHRPPRLPYGRGAYPPGPPGIRGSRHGGGPDADRRVAGRRDQVAARHPSVNSRTLANRSAGSARVALSSTAS